MELVVAIFMFSLPLGMTAFAWRMARASYALTKHGVRSLGTVTRVVRGYRTTVTVQYTAEETTYQTETDSSYGSSLVGDTVPVVYLPTSPGRGYVDHWQDLWMPPFLWLLTAVFIGLPLYGGWLRW